MTTNSLVSIFGTKSGEKFIELTTLFPFIKKTQKVWSPSLKKTLDLHQTKEDTRYLYVLFLTNICLSFSSNYFPSHSLLSRQRESGKIYERHFLVYVHTWRQTFCWSIFYITEKQIIHKMGRRKVLFLELLWNQSLSSRSDIQIK